MMQVYLWAVLPVTSNLSIAATVGQHDEGALLPPGGLTFCHKVLDRYRTDIDTTEHNATGACAVTTTTTRVVQKLY